MHGRPFKAGKIIGRNGGDSLSIFYTDMTPIDPKMRLPAPRPKSKVAKPPLQKTRKPVGPSAIIQKAARKKTEAEMSGFWSPGNILAGFMIAAALALTVPTVSELAGGLVPSDNSNAQSATIEDAPVSRSQTISARNQSAAMTKLISRQLRGSIPQ
jgi:hypothetical protein